MASNSMQRIQERISAKLSGGEGTHGKFDAKTPDVLTRYMGGHYRNNQPFVTGYHQVMFELPQRLFGANSSNAQKWFTSTCETFTPHSVTVNFADVMGIGQIGSSFMTSKVIGREFTLGFREYQHLPIMTFIDLWHSVFDEHTGASPLDGDEYVPSTYKGSCVVFQLKPTGARNDLLQPNDIEEIYVYQGVWPKTNPRDTAGASDQTSNEFIQLSVTFSFDGAPLSLNQLTTSDARSFIDKLNGLGKYANSFDAAISAATNIASSDRGDGTGR